MGTLKAVFANLGIYKRKLLFFSIVFIVFFGGAKIAQLVKDNSSYKVEASPEGVNMATDTSDYYTILDIKSNGKIYNKGRQADQSIIQRSDYDELRFIVLDQPRTYYSNVNIEVNLPKPLIRPPENPIIIAVHGAEPVSAALEKSKIVYKAKNVGSVATVTVVQKFPKGYFNFPIEKQIGGFVNNLPGLFWVILGITLPTVGIFVIIRVAFLNNLLFKEKMPKKILDSPPSNISPAVVSVLVDGKVGPRTIAAMLADLARRGFVDIYNRGEDFAIYRKSAKTIANPPLKPYEQILLDKIFSKEHGESNMRIIERRLSDELFSREVSLVYLDVYAEANSMGYFNNMPPTTHLQYRFMGISMFLLSLLGFFFFVLVSPDPKFVLIFWIALMGISMGMVNIAPNLTSFSKKGRFERDKWLAFKNFLSLDGDIHEAGSLFVDYFAYSIALDCEADWAARFVEATFQKPSWYDLNTDVAGTDGFTESFLPIINYISETLSLANDPLVQ